MTTKRKRHLKSKFALIQTSSILLHFIWICKILAKLYGVESERTLSQFGKKKRKFLCWVHQLHKAGAWNKEVSSRRLATTAKKCTKSVMHVQSCCFANVNRLLFCRSRCRRRQCCLSAPLLWSRNTDSYHGVTLLLSIAVNSDHDGCALAGCRLPPLARKCEISH